LNADLKAARLESASTIEFSYQSAARAIAILDRPAARIQIDGAAAALVRAGPNTIFLPRGQHIVTLSIESASPVMEKRFLEKFIDYVALFASGSR